VVKAGNRGVVSCRIWFAGSAWPLESKAVQPFVHGAEIAGDVAAIGDDGVEEFVREGPVQLAGHDAEVTADLDDDGADRAAAPSAAIPASVGRRARG